MSTDGKPSYEKNRSSPRAQAALEVDVEVAGEMKTVRLLSRDIGAGGMFLRTEQPAPLWKKVKLRLQVPDGDDIEVVGEVVRSVPPEKARQSKYPAGMAIAFDESSRAKRKQLVELVLDLCTRQSREEEPPPKPPRQQQPAAATTAKQPEPAGPAAAGKSDDMLDEIDSLLVSMSADAGSEAAADTAANDDLELSIDVPEMVEEVEENEPPATDSPSAEQVQALSRQLADYRASVAGDTHYHTLGLDLDATPEQIETAYQELKERFQPAVSQPWPEDLRHQLEQVIKKIRKAYAILSKPDRKRAYDFLLDNLDEEF
ncbi:MAG: hypothetical protein DRI34_11665 [Deltaproteobacteria bacterium]|nr:MAG: hypothetical protein DRI34_11665 [Deltaproteobacteria bacterium]